MPDLLPANFEAFELLRACQTQIRASGFGVLGFDYVAFRMVAVDVLGMDFSLALLNKLRAVEASILARPRKE